MKRMVQFAILLAAFLLLAGVAFANGDWCECYEVTCMPYFEGYGGNITHYVEMCFEPWNGYAEFSGFCGLSGMMDLFWDTRVRAIATITEGDLTHASLEFHGGINGVTGIIDCFGLMYTLRGHIVDEENCTFQ